jgi:uncharacterized membrane protein
MNLRDALRSPLAAPVVVLGLISTLSVMMVFARWAYTGQLAYRLILWNLFLAWIPLFCSLLAHQIRGRLALVALGATWLLFLPNAPYVVTDLIHLRQREVPIWYDITMITTFVWAGIMAGCLSLFVMQQRIRAWFGAVWGWVFSIACVALSGFGVYLGRFQRWNSWDVLANPDALARDILSRIVNPFDYPRTYAFSLLMALLFGGVYLTLYAFTRIGGAVARIDQRR